MSADTTVLDFVLSSSSFFRKLKMVEKQKGDDSRKDSIKEAAGDQPVRMADQKTSKNDESKL
jgi:hypothetical protein